MAKQINEVSIMCKVSREKQENRDHKKCTRFGCWCFQSFKVKNISYGHRLKSNCYQMYVSIWQRHRYIPRRILFTPCLDACSLGACKQATRSHCTSFEDSLCLKINHTRTKTRRWTLTPPRRRRCLRHLDGLLWPWPRTSSLTRSSVGATEYSL